MTLNEPDFDWVTARAECTIAGLFALLVSAIQRDVKRMEAIDKTQGVSRRFVVNATETDCRVMRTPGGHQPMEAGVVASLASDGRVRVDAIQPNHERRSMFTAAVHLQEDGQCRLAIDDAPLPVWQVSKRALEDLFFGGEVGA